VAAALSASARVHLQHGAPHACPWFNVWMEACIKQKQNAVALKFAVIGNDLKFSRSLETQNPVGTLNSPEWCPTPVFDGFLWNPFRSFGFHVFSALR